MTPRRRLHKNADSPRSTEQRSARQWPASVWFLIFVGLAGLGYVTGIYHAQIYNTVASRLGLTPIYTDTIDLSSVQATYQALKANYDGETDDAALIEGANKGLVSAAGDQYTEYFSASDSESFDDSLNGDIGGGIGAEIGLRNGQPTVVRVLAGNPAEKSGLLANDVILKVNDESAIGATVNDTVTKIRGEIGTTVKIEIMRDSEAKEFTITRDQVNNPSVYSKVEGTLGTLTVIRFDDATADLARTAAQQFKKAGVTKVILDLRGNGGGYLTAAQQLAGLWINDKIVVIEKRGDTVTDQLLSGTNPLLEGIETVVLINGSSASASEILAGALQDYKVATIVGEKSYGKGSVQKLLNLGGGAQLKVTIAKWYTPNGKNINQEGITPDKVVEMTLEDSDAGRDPQMAAAKAQLGF